jgi:hypothetical protein
MLYNSRMATAHSRVDSNISVQYNTTSHVRSAAETLRRDLNGVSKFVKPTRGIQMSVSVVAAPSLGK